MGICSPASLSVGVQSQILCCVNQPLLEFGRAQVGKGLEEQRNGTSSVRRSHARPGGQCVERIYRCPHGGPLCPARRNAYTRHEEVGLDPPIARWSACRKRSNHILFGARSDGQRLPGAAWRPHCRSTRPVVACRHTDYDAMVHSSIARSRKRISAVAGSYSTQRDVYHLSSLLHSPV